MFNALYWGRISFIWRGIHKRRWRNGLLSWCHKQNAEESHYLCVEEYIKYNTNNGCTREKKYLSTADSRISYCRYINVLRRPGFKNPNPRPLFDENPLKHVISNQSRYWESIPEAEGDWLKIFASIPMLAESRPRADRASNPVSPASSLSIPSGWRNLLPVWSRAGWEFDAVSRGTVTAGDPAKCSPACEGRRILSCSTGFGTMKT